MDEANNFHAPIRSFFILNMGGVPIFARRYEVKSNQGAKLDDSGAVLLAGFLAAVEMFSRTNLHGKLVDIGFETERYFFRRTPDDEFLVVGSTEDLDDPYQMQEREETIYHILEKSSEAFEVIVSTSRKFGLEIDDVTASFGSTLDSIILEAPMFLESERYESVHSKLTELVQADDEFDEVITKVQNFFKKHQ